MLYLDYHIFAAFNLPASCKPVHIDLHIPSLSMGQKEVFVGAFLNGKPESIRWPDLKLTKYMVNNDFMST